MGHYGSGELAGLDLSSAMDGLGMDLPSYDRHRTNTIRAENVCYEVDERGLEWWQKIAAFQMPWEWGRSGDATKRQILKSVSFSIESGQMLAVMGSSGSGKTTLLDVISGHEEGGEASGRILVNGQDRTVEVMKEYSAYVRQNDRLLPHLTVKETLMFVAQLKLPNTWSQIKIEDRVESVIAELGLRHVADTKVGGAEIRGISGGERRRVSIGVQLLLDPNILFLDEPTSGLDSFTAHHLVETLQKLSSNNRIVILSIHQPRSDIFELFDLIMLLSQGNVVYFGKANNMVNYFTELGYPCPELTNPCDYYVDLTTVDMKTLESEGTTAERVNQLVDIYNSKEVHGEHESEFISYDSSSGHRQNGGVSQGANVQGTHVQGSANTEPARPPGEHATDGDYGASAEQRSTTNAQDSPKAARVADETEMTEFRGGYANEGYVAEEDEVTEFNVSPSDVVTTIAQSRDGDATATATDVEPAAASSSRPDSVSRGEEQQAPATVLFCDEPGTSGTSSGLQGNTLFSSNTAANRHSWSSSSTSQHSYRGAVPDYTRYATHDTQGASTSSAPPPPLPSYEPPRDMDVITISSGVSQASAAPRPRFSSTVVVSQEEKAGSMQQFWVLFRRALTNNLEDYSFLGVQAIEALAMSLMIGLVFYNLGTGQIGIRDRFGLLYIIGALYPYMVILDVVGQYHRERYILYFEMRDNLYTTAPYFFAKVLSELPEHTFFIVLYTCPVYFMAGLQDRPDNFFLTFTIVFLVVYCSRAMAMSAAATMPTYQLSVLVAQALFTCFLLSCGFIFNLENIFDGVKWMSYLSYLKWSYQAMCHVEFNNLNFTCTLPVEQSCIYTGDEALAVYSLDGNNVWQCSLIVCAEITGFLVLFFLAMRFISQKPHEQ